MTGCMGDDGDRLEGSTRIGHVQSTSTGQGSRVPYDWKCRTGDDGDRLEGSTRIGLVQSTSATPIYCRRPIGNKLEYPSPTRNEHPIGLLDVHCSRPIGSGIGSAVRATTETVLRDRLGSPMSTPALGSTSRAAATRPVRKRAKRPGPEQ
jgi:hypothetical protein